MKKDQRILEIAKRITREHYGNNVEVIMLKGTPTICENKAKRWEFKCFFASPIDFKIDEKKISQLKLYEFYMVNASKDIQEIVK